MTDTQRLRCPKCGGRIMVEMGPRGHGYLSYDAPDSFFCDQCDAAWDLEGNPTS
jgi:hypothetical protein